jgi:dTDP-4-amino-4,6-dideoxygalactose transaminase
MNGNLQAFSFGPIKTFTAGGGGMLIVNEEFYQRAKRLRWYGYDRSKPIEKQNIYESGFKYHMTDIEASIGRANLRHVDRLLAVQESNASYYRTHLGDICVHPAPGLQSSNWLFPVFVDNRYDLERLLSEHGIEARPGHYRNDSHVCVSNRGCSLQGMDKVQRTMTCIPCGWWVTPADRERIVDVVKKG